jgi:hypothetical protein
VNVIVWSGYAVAFLAGAVVGIPIGKRIAVWASEEFDVADKEEGPNR